MTNSTKVLTWTDLYNNRHWDDWLAMVSPEVQFVDLAQDVTLKGREELLAYGKAWVEAFSDVQYTQRRLLEDGDVAVLRFIGRGTNDGPWGELPATGKVFSGPGTNIIEFDSDGLISNVEQLYDRLTVLTHLGHAQQPVG